MQEQYPHLPKWSHIVVNGNKVTKEQAAEIIIRTTNLNNLSCNDNKWTEKLNFILEESLNTNELSNSFEDVRLSLTRNFPKGKGLASKTILNVDYLENHQIVSTYVGGPYGWCDWDGNIGCFGYNIGKWPTVEEIKNEWELIASTWPFLNLRCQLWSGNYGEDGIFPVIEFIVQNGIVNDVKPLENLSEKTNNYYKIRNLSDNRTERGCTLEQFKAALEITKKSLLNTN